MVFSSRSLTRSAFNLADKCRPDSDSMERGDAACRGTAQLVAVAHRGRRLELVFLSHPAHHQGNMGKDRVQVDF